jgi:hypothetical protein
MKGQLPSPSIPFIEGDFNACGWAGNGDESIYVLDMPTLVAISAADGMHAFVWTDDEQDTIFGVVGILEYMTLGAFTGWRAKPVPGTFYRGPKPAELLGGAVV